MINNVTGTGSTSGTTGTNASDSTPLGPGGKLGNMKFQRPFSRANIHRLLTDGCAGHRGAQTNVMASGRYVSEFEGSAGEQIGTCGNATAITRRQFHKKDLGVQDRTRGSDLSLENRNLLVVCRLGQNAAR